MVEDIYVVFEESRNRDWYVTDYSTRQGQVAVSETIRDARKFTKHEAERVAEHFGMIALKINSIT